MIFIILFLLGVFSFAVAVFYDLRGDYIKAEIATCVGVGFLMYPCLFAFLCGAEVFG